MNTCVTRCLAKLVANWDYLPAWQAPRSQLPRALPLRWSAENPRFAWTFLRVVLHNTLHNRIRSVRVESRLRYFLSFCSRGNTRIEVLLNKSSKLQT